VTSAEIVDSHHHLWDPAALLQPFRAIPELNRPFTAAQFETEAERVGIRQSICVEAASAGTDSRRETDWLLRQIEDNQYISALVAWAPLERPDLGQYLDWLTSLAGKPIVGVRRSFEFEPDDFPKQPEVIEGAQLFPRLHVATKPRNWEHLLLLAGTVTRAKPDPRSSRRSG
jgi:predicted TIM-barrel fold metal-dependent hydrolase